MLSKQLQFDLLVTAIEGGSNYWYFLPDRSMCAQSKTGVKSVETDADDMTLVGRMWLGIEQGASIPVSDVDGSEDEILGYISKETIETGCLLMEQEYPNAYADAITGDWDADTADTWFQLVVMGEIVFG